MGKHKKPKNFTVPKAVGSSLVFNYKKNGQLFVVSYRLDRLDRTRVTPHDKFYVDELKVQLGQKWCDCKDLFDSRDEYWTFINPLGTLCEHGSATLRLNSKYETTNELRLLLDPATGEEYELLLNANELLREVIEYVVNNENKYYEFFWKSIRGTLAYHRPQKRNQRAR